MTLAELTAWQAALWLLVACAIIWLLLQIFGRR